MPHQMPPLPWLRAFEASARHLSFTHAAAELSLTQAAISKQVKLLEHYLREPLFERLPRSLILTKAGAAYMPKVNDAFERLSAGTTEVFGGRRKGILTVRAPIGWAVNWMAERLSSFMDDHPKIPVRIVSSVWSDEAETLRYDLDIRYGTGKWPGIRADRVSWESLEPLCTPEIARRLHSPDDLEHERLLHVMGYQEGWATWLAAAGVTKINPGSGAHFDSSLIAFEVAAHGGGVALGRSSMSATELRAGRLVRPFTLSVTIDESFYILTPDEGLIHPDAMTFRDWLLAEVAKSRPEAE